MLDKPGWLRTSYIEYTPCSGFGRTNVDWPRRLWLFVNGCGYHPHTWYHAKKDIENFPDYIEVLITMQNRWLASAGGISWRQHL